MFFVQKLEAQTHGYGGVYIEPIEPYYPQHNAVDYERQQAEARQAEASRKAEADRLAEAARRVEADRKAKRVADALVLKEANLKAGFKKLETEAREKIEREKIESDDRAEALADKALDEFGSSGMSLEESFSGRSSSDRIDSEGYLLEAARPGNNGLGGGFALADEGFLASEFPDNRPDRDGYRPEGKMTAGDLAERQAAGYDARQGRENIKRDWDTSLRKAEEMHEQQREKFALDWDKEKHPDLGGAPLSKVEIREARERVLNGQPIDPSVATKLRKIEADSRQEADKITQEMNAQAAEKLSKGTEVYEVIKTADRILNSPEAKKPAAPQGSMLDLNGP